MIPILEEKKITEFYFLEGTLHASSQLIFIFPFTDRETEAHRGYRAY